MLVYIEIIACFWEKNDFEKNLNLNAFILEQFVPQKKTTTD